MPVTEVQQFGFDIRDAFFNVVTADTFFANYTQRKSKWRAVQTDLVPYLGVYLVGEQRTGDGDPNCGCIRFSHTVTVGFSVVQAGDDSTVLEQNVDQAYQKIDTLLWTNISLMNVLHNNNPEGVGIESIPRSVTRKVFGSARANNEFPFIELEYNVNAFCRSEWYPDITDMLDEIDVTTYVDNAPAGSITPIQSVYYLNPPQVRKPRRPWLLRRDQH